jgi:hypothetical protein
MNDRYLIEKYLNYYECVCDYNNTSNKIQLIDDLTVKFKFDGKILNKLELVNEVIRIYGNFSTDKNISTYYIVENWFEKKIKDYYQPIFDTLKEVQVIFGRTSWEVHKDGKEYSLNDLVEIHKINYSYETIKTIYNVWKYEEIIVISENMLND